MGDVGLWQGREFRLFLLLASTCLASGGALAQQVTGYVTIQPIDVCSSTGASCAPFNTTSAVGNPKNQDQSKNPIGFVDPAGINYARAVWARSGIDLTYLPIVQYNSATKPNGLTYQTLDVVTGTQACGFPNAPATGFQSCDFLKLSQQAPPNGISSTHTVPNPTSPSGVPVFPQPTVINMFFVNKLNPPPSQSGGQLYGFSWLGNNGIAIAANTFFPPSKLLAPRPDTIPHELGHNLGLDHADPFNPGSPRADLITVGDSRTEPSVKCIFGAPPTPPPSPDPCANLPTLLNGMADQLNEASPPETAPPQPPLTQLGEVLTSGFVSAVPFSTTTVGATGGGGLLGAARAPSSPAAGPSPKKNSTSMFFDIFGPSTPFGPHKTLIALIVTLPKGLQFDPTNPFRISQFSPNLVQGAPQILHGNNGNLLGVCAPAADCLLVDFIAPGLTGFDFLEFSIGIRSHGAPINPSDLTAGGEVTYIFSDGYGTTSALTDCGFQQVCADSQTPDLKVASLIVNPSAFQGSGNPLPCTPPAGSSGCPDPTMTGISDADPSHEGGQIGGTGP